MTAHSEYLTHVAFIDSWGSYQRLFCFGLLIFAFVGRVAGCAFLLSLKGYRDLHVRDILNFLLRIIQKANLWKAKNISKKVIMSKH